MLFFRNYLVYWRISGKFGLARLV